MKSILLVDDEAFVAQAQLSTLREFKFHVELAQTSEEAKRWVKTTAFDLILIDLNLKSETSDQVEDGLGTGLVRELRAAGITTPILMWTVMEGYLYESASLDAGADDYIYKKTAMPLFLSKIYAHMRRSDRDLGRSPAGSHRIEVGDFMLDPESYILSAGATPIQLTEKQAKILELLAANPSRVVPTKELLDKVWKSDLRKSPALLDGAIHRIREKLKSYEFDDIIQNVKGRGYMLHTKNFEQTISV